MTTFAVPGIPAGKARPRFVRVGPHVRTYTPQKSAAFEDRIRLFAEAAGVEYIADGPVELCVVAYWPMRGQPRKRKPRPGCWKTTKPDGDNLLKSVADALNGLSYRDDAQITRAVVEKRHCGQDDADGARVVVTVGRLEEPQ